MDDTVVNDDSISSRVGDTSPIYKSIKIKITLFSPLTLSRSCPKEKIRLNEISDFFKIQKAVLEFFKKPDTRRQNQNNTFYFRWLK